MQQDKFHEYGPGTGAQGGMQTMDMPVGEILRRARAYYGLSLEQVAAALRIRAVQLEALEENRPDLLPGRVYAIGFVRSYSEYLGLDGDKMVYLFKTQSVGQKSKPELSFPIPASESKLPDKKILAGSLAGLVMVITIMMTLHGGEDSEGIPPVPAKTAIIEKPASVAEVKMGPFLPSPEDLAAITPAAGNAKAETAVVPQNVVIDFTDSAWVEIRTPDGEILISRVLKKGDRYIVPQDKELVMDTGNAGALEISVNGRIVPVLGKPGSVRRNISLSAESLSERFPEEN